MSSLDKQGMAARKLQAEYTAEGKGYRERQKEKTAKQRVLLVPIVAALKNGETVNGQKGIENWAKWWNPTAKYPERQLQRIVGEPTETTETTSRRVAKWTEGMVISIDGVKHEVGSMPKRSVKSVGGYYTFTFSAKFVEEPKKEEQTTQAEEEKQADRFFKFIGIHDFAKATRAYKKAIKEAHPDNGGDTRSAALVNAAWDDYKKQNGWTGSPKKEEKTAPTEKIDLIRVSLTKAQMREIEAVREEVKITGAFKCRKWSEHSSREVPRECEGTDLGAGAAHP